MNWSEYVAMTFGSASICLKYFFLFKLWLKEPGKHRSLRFTTFILKGNSQIFYSQILKLTYFSFKFQAQCLVEDGFENKIKMRDENINNKVHKTHGSAKLLLLKISPQCLHFGGSIFFGTKLKANTKMETDVEQARAGVNSMFSPFCTLLFFSQIHQEGVKRMRVQQ